MALDLAGIGAVLQGAGAASSIFGSTSDGFSKKGNWQSLKFQEQAMPTTMSMYTRNKENEWNSMMSNAKKHGIHPLFAMGQQSNSPAPSIIAGQSDNGGLPSDAISNMGRSISNYSSSKFNKRMALAQMQQGAALSTAQIRSYNASADADLALAQQRVSQTARLAQSSNSEQDKIINPLPFATNPANTDQQVIEDMYGGVVGEISGVSRYVSELYNKYVKTPKNKRFYKKINPRASSIRQTYRNFGK